MTLGQLPCTQPPAKMPSSMSAKASIEMEIGLMHRRFLQKRHSELQHIDHEGRAD
jgi:hypothetical protein